MGRGPIRTTVKGKGKTGNKRSNSSSRSRSGSGSGSRSRSNSRENNSNLLSRTNSGSARQGQTHQGSSSSTSTGAAQQRNGHYQTTPQQVQQSRINAEARARGYDLTNVPLDGSPPRQPGAMSSGHSPTSSSSRAPNNQSGGASSSTAQTGAAAAPTNPPQNPNAVAGAPAHQPNQHYQPAPAQAAGGGQQAAAGGGQQAAPPPAANAGGMVGQAQPVQNVGVYGPAPAGVNAMGVAGGPANRNWLGRMRHRIYKNPRKTAGYSTLALLLGAGVGTTAAYFAGAFDSNSPNHPKAENHSVKGVRKRNTKSKTGIKNDPVRSHDLTKHVSPANESSDAKIDNKTFQLYASTDIEEEGATEVTSNGTWKVTQTGKLTFTPGDTFIAGVAIIFYTVKDKRGIDSNRASVTIQYGPEASNGTLDNQPIDKKSAVFDIAKNVKPIDSSEEFAIDLSTAELVFRDRSGNEVVNSNSLAASGGTWSLADGKISFTPGPGFVSQMAIIGYQVKDKMGTWSNEALLTLNFKSKSIMMDGDDKAKPDLRYMPQMVVNRQPFDLQISAMPPINKSSIEISTSSAGDFVKELTIEGEGIWRVGSGKVSFTPFMDFREAPSPIFYRAKSEKGVLSDTLMIVVQIFPKPVAVDNNYPGIRAVVDVLANDRVTYAGEGNKIDITSVEFYAVVPPQGEEPDVRIATNRRKAEVAGEGTWKINSRTGKISFVPIEGFSGVPTPISYTFMDTKGSESDPAIVTLNKASTELQNMVAAMAEMSQMQFWRNYLNVLGNKRLDQIMVVTYQLRELFYGMLSDEFRMDVDNARGLLQEDIDAIFNNWLMDDFSVATLVNEVESRGGQRAFDLKTRPRNFIGARVMYMDEILRALDKYFEAFEKATGS